MAVGVAVASGAEGFENEGRVVGAVGVDGKFAGCMKRFCDWPGVLFAAFRTTENAGRVGGYRAT